MESDSRHMAASAKMLVLHEMNCKQSLKLAGLAIGNHRLAEEMANKSGLWRH